MPREADENNREAPETAQVGHNQEEEPVSKPHLYILAHGSIILPVWIRRKPTVITSLYFVSITV